jgi:DNA-binding NarL/FixJ family response regulator
VFAICDGGESEYSPRRESISVRPRSDAMLATQTINQATALRTANAARPGHFKRDTIGSLTHREIEIVRLLCDGKSSKEIGSDLKISPRTVDIHRANILGKLELHCMALLVRWSIRNGIIEA